jgi:hypothetical protein
MISTHGVTALALMPAVAKLFLGDQSTSWACLRGSTCVNFEYPNTGAFSLVLQDRKKLVPARVLHCTGQPVVLDHPFDVQAFHRDSTVAVYQFGRDLVMPITASISNMRVHLSYTATLFFRLLLPFFFRLRLRLSTCSLRKAFLSGCIVGSCSPS